MFNCKRCNNPVNYSDAKVEQLCIKEGFCYQLNGNLYASLCFNCFSQADLKAQITYQSFANNMSEKQYLEEILKNYQD